ncbi:SHOCT domain-containing protein [Halomicrobium sp. IBSBa]|uniref:SHOCT domain-containing protein n=1 Tax=Halomicrobium sp. IBSBa TaxID=2778916 RepID=UPI001ABF7A76|nr:SHOCT domain-containing protein [Halomicrobium sp. IBSBa]MBO4247428.1 SHOCT domain-containing protein [Halomicrobium sp. IBSBa]
MGYVDRFTPADPYARSLLGLAFASVPQTVFLFALLVGINVSEHNEVLFGASALTLLVLFVGFLCSTHVAQLLFRDVSRRAGSSDDATTDTDSAFRRLASAGVGAIVGVPAFVYGVFVALLAWPVQASLYAGRAVGVGVLFLGIFSLYYAHETAKDVSEQAAPREQTAESRDATSKPDPVATLKRRYAAGELSEEAFERKLDQLIGTADDVTGADPGSDAAVAEPIADSE